MGLGLKHQNRGHGSRDLYMDGGVLSRTKWTKRKRTAISLLTVFGIIAGIAVAYKLFDRTVPNNVVRDAATFDFTIEAYDSTAGESTYRPVTGLNDEVIFRQSKVAGCAGQQPTGLGQPDQNTTEPCNVSTYPGSGRGSNVKITNANTNPARTASFQTYINQGSITVMRYDLDKNKNGIVDPGDIDYDNDNVLDEYHVVPTSDPDWATFVSFWSLSIKKQSYYRDPIYTNNEDYENPYSNGDSRVATNCSGRPLTAVTVSDPCRLGQIKASGSDGASMVIGPPTAVGVGDIVGNYPSSPLDDREYSFSMSEAETGSDQSTYLGWRIAYDLVFIARLAPEPEGDRYIARPYKY